MRTNRLTERDLTRIVRRVINEHPMGLLDDADIDLDLDSSKKMSLEDFIYDNMGMRFVGGQIPQSVISEPGAAYPLMLETNKGESITIGADGMVEIRKIK